LHVSLNDLAVEVLRRQPGKHPEHVFTYRGKPIRWPNTRGWRAALLRAGIDNFRWHDLRHTWASWPVQHGTPLYDLREMEVEVGRDGAALRAPGAGPDGQERGRDRFPAARHEYVTVPFAALTKKGLRNTAPP
jgi:hypothetical protein